MSVGRFDLSQPGALGGYATATAALATTYSRAVGAQDVVQRVSRETNLDPLTVRARLEASPDPPEPGVPHPGGRPVARRGDGGRQLDQRGAGGLRQGELAGPQPREPGLLKRFRTDQVAVVKANQELTAAKQDLLDDDTARNRAAVAEAQATFAAAQLRVQRRLRGLHAEPRGRLDDAVGHHPLPGHLLDQRPAQHLPDLPVHRRRRRADRRDRARRARGGPELPPVPAQACPSALSSTRGRNPGARRGSCSVSAPSWRFSCWCAGSGRPPSSTTAVYGTVVGSAALPRLAHAAGVLLHAGARAGPDGRQLGGLRHSRHRQPQPGRPGGGRHRRAAAGGASMRPADAAHPARALVDGRRERLRGRVRPSLRDVRQLARPSPGSASASGSSRSSPSSSRPRSSAPSATGRSCSSRWSPSAPTSA